MKKLINREECYFIIEMKCSFCKEKHELLLSIDEMDSYLSGDPFVACGMCDSADYMEVVDWFIETGCS